jgi:hypothetical protein
MRNLQRLAVLSLTAVVLLHAGRAWAPFHLIAIDEVFLGTPECPNAQYVMLRLLSPGMVFVNNQTVRGQNPDGSSGGDFGKFPNKQLSNGLADARFIVGTSAAAGLFGMTFDATASGQLTSSGGRVCFGFFPIGTTTPVDCVAYGDFTGDNGIYGMPADAPPLGMALSRQTNGMDNKADFAVGAPAPRNNAGDAGTLGQCPSGETPTPTSEPTTPEGNTPTPTATVPPAGGCVGDCNGDGSVVINELIVAVNIALGASPVSMCAASACEEGPVVSISCLIQAVNAALSGCPAAPTATVGVDPGPTKTPGGALGVRRFSLNPATSRFVAVLSPVFNVPTVGFEGFLELTAGVPDPATGIASVDVTDASDYLAVDVPTAGIAVCVRVLRDQLPVRQAGIVACKGGIPLGLQLTQDHDVGVVGTCVGGDNAGQSCAGDGGCFYGQCFTADTCAAVGGSVEGPGRPHAGVCNGPFEGGLDSEVSPPGTVLISPDPVNGFTKGLPVEIVQEHTTPCGDEGATGFSTSIALTSGHAVGRVLHFNDSAATLSADVTGAPFSCDAWSAENGPGTLVLSAANLDTPVAPGSVTDIITEFVFTD